MLGTDRQGSGVVVGAGGLVLTVNYVVTGAEKVNATDTDGNTFSGGVVAQDFASGLAVIAFDDPVGLAEPARRGTSKRLSLGVDVIALAALGDSERRVAWGVVSSLEPLDAYWEYRLDRAISVTCVNPGLGGGPLVTPDGRLVGLCSLNLGVLGRATMAIPVENYFDYEDELLEHGRRISREKRAWVGMFCHSFPDGTVVAGLIPGGPGETHGLHVGDVLVDIDGEPVVSRSQLYQELWSRKPGDDVKLSVSRDGALETVTVVGGDVEDFFG